MQVYDVRSESQSHAQFDANSLNAEDRRLCSMLRFVIRRSGSCQPVLHKGLLRIPALADDKGCEHGSLS